MAIGVFDSGVGGLTIHRALTERFPAADFVYLADQAHMPYGPRSGEDIVRLTRTGCRRLFREGCDLVVLACNTASAVALRRLQRLWLPEFRRESGRCANVLGIIVPTIEVATGRPWSAQDHAAQAESRAGTQVLGVFATRATARSRVYEIEVEKRRPDLSVVTEPCPHLAALIEQGAARAQLAEVIGMHVTALHNAIGHPPQQVILGSTHYEVVAELFREALAPTTQVIRQPCATADALQLYLARHPEFAAGSAGVRRFLTTGTAGTQNSLAASCWGQPLAFESVQLD
jgi:glutamate racemase